MISPCVAVVDTDRIFIAGGQRANDATDMKAYLLTKSTG